MFSILSVNLKVTVRQKFTLIFIGATHTNQITVHICILDKQRLVMNTNGLLKWTRSFILKAIVSYIFLKSGDLHCLYFIRPSKSYVEMLSVF